VKSELLPDVTAIGSALAGAGVTSAEVEKTSLGVTVRARATELAALLPALRDSSSEFTFMVDLFGVDTGEGVELVYHLRSFSRDEDIFVRMAVDYDGSFASVWEIYPAALMPEREIAEMFGLSLQGHPNPKRLLTTDGMDPMLLKRVEIRGPEEVRSR
jgi:NADH:ubiquinone oxidoreductase subunit C